MPRARGAHLDVVAEHRLTPTPKPLQLGRRARAPPSGRQSCAEHIGHLHRADLSADGAVVGERATNVARGPQQLGVRVADVIDADPAAADLSHQRVAHEAILHACLGNWILHTPASTWARAEHHAARLPPDSCRLAGARPSARRYIDSI